MTLKPIVLAALAASVATLAMPAAAQETPLPDYYPADYSELIEAWRGEDGLVVYSNMGENNWQPVVAGFQERYPWISVETLDLGSGTVHSRTMSSPQ